MRGRRSGFINEESEGAFTTPFGKLTFNGTRHYIRGGGGVSLTHGEGDASGRLVFPRLWEIVSCANRVNLWIQGDASPTFEIWRPWVWPQETVGRFRPRDGEIIELYAHNPGGTAKLETLEHVLAGASARGLAFVTYADFARGEARAPGLALSFDNVYGDAELPELIQAEPAKAEG